ncbi:class I SAM-dependent methyltransferase [Nocardiopsis sp. HNM0947]|uniref:Class I SAM-dependent methyltransferase n=1 Tax=Nocardiopsis coralli TaxID=2772213 RepID=A0ABR9P7S3_9ACTN|nr:class I SAM-dependent methyltransferase [Nocardiopsis coralli]MBE2999895.1 class I SAM-dependent methyltransferase [Nocardiopsis coralli]
MASRSERRHRVDPADRQDHGERVPGPVLHRTRELLCAGARGRTLEVGVGSGRNLPFYPPQVRLTAIDTDPAKIERAREHAAELALPGRFLVGDVQDLDFPDRSFDTVMCTLTLGAVDDQAAAMREMYRVLEPGGRLLMVDRIGRARLPFRLVEQRRRNPRRLPREVAVEAGFRVGHHDRLMLGTIERVVAHRP